MSDSPRYANASYLGNGLSIAPRESFGTPILAIWSDDDAAIPDEPVNEIFLDRPTAVALVRFMNRTNFITSAPARKEHADARY